MPKGGPPWKTLMGLGWYSSQIREENQEERSRKASLGHRGTPSEMKSKEGLTRGHASKKKVARQAKSQKKVAWEARKTHPGSHRATDSNAHGQIRGQVCFNLAEHIRMWRKCGQKLRSV